MVAKPAKKITAEPWTGCQRYSLFIRRTHWELHSRIDPFLWNHYANNTALGSQFCTWHQHKIGHHHGVHRLIRWTHLGCHCGETFRMSCCSCWVRQIISPQLMMKEQCWPLSGIRRFSWYFCRCLHHDLRSVIRVRILNLVWLWVYMVGRGWPNNRWTIYLSLSNWGNKPVNLLPPSRVPSYWLWYTSGLKWGLNPLFSDSIRDHSSWCFSPTSFTQTKQPNRVYGLRLTKNFQRLLNVISEQAESQSPENLDAKDLKINPFHWDGILCYLLSCSGGQVRGF